MTDSPSRKGLPDDSVLPLVEETLRVDVHERVSARVRVRTATDVVQELARADLRSETVDITRVPVDRPVDAPPEIRTEGDVVIVPVVEEVLVVEKRLVLREELHIRRSVTTEHVEMPVNLRRQQAVVERLAADEAGSEESSSQETQD
ncbi:YsnF/AvaK domain-containing protein [Microvirga subterranea]|uniref:Uncharacterized protein DUF2382 n=1 Tax=Microvirga subterranea TaxID=186651 RepID=A0A370HIC3_9HYPH|nr:YsnF/AvaK domain-containing protein [Microvirga subterranea]RDI57947.1 uncharacterized protein DUF2382 [Microvirga subterranea]